LGHLAVFLQSLVSAQLFVHSLFAFAFFDPLPLSAKAEADTRVKANMAINIFFIFLYFNCFKI
jgi:hypothetical protein